MILEFFIVIIIAMICYVQKHDRIRYDQDRNEEIRIKNLAIESASDGIIITKGDGDHEIIYCNKAYQQITGYPKEEIIGKNPRFLQGTYTDEQSKNKIRNAIKNLENIEVEILNYTKDGTPFWNKSSISPIYNDNGKMTNFLGVIKDITEEVMMRRKLKETNENLEEFAYIVSHDLKAPLRTIRVMSDLLTENEKNDLSPNKLEYIDRIHASSQRMRELIESLLMFSRITRTTEPFEEANIIDIAREALADLQINDKLELKILSDIPMMSVDKIQMRQVFQNLFDNSIKFYREEEDLIIKISYSSQYGYHVVKYEDNGMGFDMSQKDFVFKPFYQIYPEYEGTGMGMAICKKIIERHRGMIEVESEIGVGTVFYIKLPLEPISRGDE